MLGRQGSNVGGNRQTEDSTTGSTRHGQSHTGSSTRSFVTTTGGRGTGPLLRSSGQPPRPSTSISSRASHFQGSRNTTVHGGQFHNTLGHHTNLIVNLNQSGYANPEGVNISNPNTDASIPENLAMLNDLRNRNAQTVMQLPVQRSNEVYERHLLLKGRGFPLWIPEPNKNLTMAYQRQGISIGDVGIITSSGSFSFLFNICLPPDHPVNPRSLPEGFVTIDPPIDPSDIRKFAEFKPSSFLASRSIMKSSQVDDTPLSFVTKASEGAILVMPEGAISHDLENISRFRAYAAANVESWYRYANGPRGRQAKNGDIRLVIGCDKSTSWGMATLSDASQERTSYMSRQRSDYLKLVSKRVCPEDVTSQLMEYSWEYSGVAEVRAGPDPAETNEWRADDPSPSPQYSNQCIFVRTLNPMLGPDLWQKINHDLGLTLEADDTNNAETNRSPAGLNSGSRSSSSNSKTILAPAHNHQPMQPSPEMKGYENGSPPETVKGPLASPPTAASHPSDDLNHFLFSIVKNLGNIQMVITEDEDWCWIMRTSHWSRYPTSHQLFAEILKFYEIKFDGGATYLKKSVAERPYAGLALDSVNTKIQNYY